MPRYTRRDIFACGKSDIVRFSHSDIIFASLTAVRQYHSAESRISLRSNITRRKANITEKSTCICKCFFLGSPSWTRTNDNISCGARRKTSLERRFSVDRCAILPSLLLPPAALGHDAVNKPLGCLYKLSSVEFNLKVKK